MILFSYIFFSSSVATRTAHPDIQPTEWTFGACWILWGIKRKTTTSRTSRSPTSWNT